ncbi:endonuclease domain-containing protein [Mycobacterium sp. 23]|uniref:endonuclease domain-containing protein n=1 Tax=Mycobacterium sp. 23 TaxID=3400424 RepID=UPI003AAB7014
MASVFRGSEALTSSALTRGQLRWRYRRIHPDIYLPKDASRTLRDNICAAWLWSGRKGIVAGRAAAAMHGTRWVDDFAPVELLGPFNHPPPGVIVRRERILADEVTELAGIPVTTPVRTAFDLGRHLPRGMAISHLDALSAASGLVEHDVQPLLVRYRGARGTRLCRKALCLMDGGAQSPRESWLRLLLIDGGLPTPITQIPVRSAAGAVLAYLDMGWEEPMVAVEYDGEQHHTDRGQYVKDIRRWEMVEDLGWRVIRVVKEDRPSRILQRVRDALAARGLAT